MAYNVVPEQIEGDNWTAQDCNVYFRDNFAAGVPDLFTTKGDIAAATGENAAARLAVGSNDQVLFSQDDQETGLVWGKVGLAKVNDPGAQNYLHTSSTNYNYTKLTELDNEFYDTAGAWADDRFTAPAPGYYLVTFFTNFRKGNFTGYSNGTIEAGEETRFFVYKNGALYSCIAAYVYQSAGLGATANANGITHYFQGVDVVYLNKGDYIEFYVWSNICINIGGVTTHTQVNAGADDQTHHASITPIAA